MPTILDDSTAQTILEESYRDRINGGSIEIREGTSTGTLIASFTLPNPAMGSASGSGIGSRTISFADLPYSATAAASSVNDTTDLFAFYKNSSDTILFGPSLVTTQADGTGRVLVSNTSGHAALARKPVIVEGNELEITVGSFTI